MVGVRIRKWEVTGWIWAGVAYLGLAVAATWPLATDLGGHLLFASRRFDGYGTLWVGEHFWRAFHGHAPLLHDTAIAWPEGLDLRLADSLLFGLLYLPFRAVFGPVAAFNAFSLSAIAATGALGYWLADRVLRVGAIGAFACGLVNAFNAVMLTYRIEGEAYLLAGFFLPLLAGQLVRVMREGRVRDGVGAGVALGALAWSSGYYAVDGAIVSGVLVLALLPASLRDGRRPWRALAVFALGSAVLVLPLAWMVGPALSGALAARFPTGQNPLVNVALDSASLSGLLVPFPATAHLRQFRIATLGMAPLTLGTLALAVRRPREWLPWMLLAAVGTVLALGPFLRLDDTVRGTVSMPYAWLVHLVPQLLAYRMPARFLAIAYLGLGALLALFLGVLSDDGLARSWRLGLLVLVAVDELLFTGFATDTTLADAEVPADYDQLSGRGAVLDLWGYDRDLLRYEGLSAFYQVAHGQPVMADFTHAGGVQATIDRRLSLALVTGDLERAAEVLSILGRLGVTDLALHPATFPEADRPVLRARLEALTSSRPPPTDAPKGVEIYAVPQQAPLDGDPAAALARIAAWREDDG